MVGARGACTCCALAKVLHEQGCCAGDSTKIACITKCSQVVSHLRSTGGIPRGMWPYVAVRGGHWVRWLRAHPVLWYLRGCPPPPSIPQCVQPLCRCVGRGASAPSRAEVGGYTHPVPLAGRETGDPTPNQEGNG